MPELFRIADVEIFALGGDKCLVRPKGGGAPAVLPESQARLERLDYRNLLKQAEAAKASAEERLAYLQKLQEDLEARRMPRGKW